VNTKVDLLLLGAFRPSAEVAVYKLARALASLIVRFSDPFFAAILPDLSRLYSSGRREEYLALIKRSMATMGPLMFCAALGGTLVANFVPTITSGKAYIAAGPLFAFGIWGFAIGGAFFWTWPAAVSIGRADLGTKVGFIVVTVQLALAVLLVPRYGALGNMAALVATYVVGQPLLAWLVLRALKTKPLPIAVDAASDPAPLAS
jgi:O-antigen/teichoic acid export membrane protein